MHNGIFPVFTKGRVLKKESIEFLRDFPYDLVSLAYDNYSDGVLFGFSAAFKNSELFISKGAVKLFGRIIIVPETLISINDYSKTLYIVLNIGESEESEDYQRCHIEITISESRTESEKEIELGRFTLFPGAVLRCGYDSFDDLRTHENTLDITHVSYAGNGAPTFHPVVMKEYAKALLLSSNDQVDIAFSLMCINESIIHKNTIQWYVAKKNNADYRDYSLSELYEKLSVLLPQQRRNVKAARPRGKGPTIL